MTRHVNNLRTALARVFVRPAYIALAGALALPIFLLAVWLPNLGLLAKVWSDADISATTTLGIALSLLGGIGTNFSLLAAGYTVATAVLFGLTAAMIVYLARRRGVATAGRGIAVGTGAMASGVLGLGCAACGSLILGMVLPALGAAGALAVLPLKGEEFGVLGIALLVVALVLVSKSIAESTSCSLARAGNGRDPWAIRR